MKSNAPDIWPKADIAKRFDVNEKDVEPSWPFSFQLEFRDRNFRLSARTRQEMNEWVRILDIYITMRM